MTIGESSSELSSPHPESQQARKPVILLWLLVFLFSMRVLGQVLQRWIMLPYLPPFDAFQGSRLPYWLLFSAQLTIIALMAWCSWRIQSGRLRARRRTGNMLAWIGGVYMLGSVLRIVVGLVLPTAPAWFSTWIPALFHVILAGFVLTLSYYHLRFSKISRQESQQ